MTFNLPRPIRPNYDVSRAKKRPLHERLKRATTNWAENGYGTPMSVVLFYLVKMIVFSAGWALTLQFNETPPTFREPESWFTHLCLVKMIVWAMSFELLGLGCGSGPLTGRYMPPIGGCLYFLRPNMVRLPLFGARKLYTRTLTDVSLYAAVIVTAMWVCFSPVFNTHSLSVILILMTIMSIRDKTMFLAGRGEHYLSMMICFLSETHWFTGVVTIQLSLWLWAAVSKLTPHFPYVVTVMNSNAPWRFLKRMRLAFFKRFPEDLRPSRAAYWLSHFGTVVEFAFPVILVANQGDLFTTAALASMVVFHAFIVLHVPMGVPLEWNLVMVYGGFFCFGDMQAYTISPAPLWMIAFLILVSGLVPLLGNLFPNRISFLPSMRYYAGNWAHSIWLFKGECSDQIQRHFSPTSMSPAVQLERLYDRQVAEAALEAVIAFRAMHLHGRVLQETLPHAVNDITSYQWLDGEVVAGWLLGWNFGDGHLHDERLLSAIQERCQFESEQLRCIFVESQPIHRRTISWRIVDAKDGEISAGTCDVDQLRQKQPFDFTHCPH